MVMNLIKDICPLINNSISGIIAGISVTIFLGFYAWLRVKCQRKDQIYYISEMAAVGIERIKAADDNETRLLYYNRLLRSIDSYLNAHEASYRIKYSEKEELRTIFPYTNDGRVAYLAALPEDVDGFFNVAIEQFRCISWLILKR